MEIELKNNRINGYKLMEKSESSCELSADIVVPDTQEDILRILFTSPVLKIRSKDIETGAVIIKGEADVNVLYVGESSAKLSILHTSIPFEKRFDVNDTSSDCFAIAGLKLTALDTRVLNPRKVLVKAEVTVSQQCYRENDIVWYTKPEEAPAKVFFKEQNRKLRYINYASEKAFTLEDEYGLNAQLDSAAIAASEVKYIADSADRVGSKMIIKGHADISLLYISNENGLENTRFSVFFSQLFDIPDGEDIPEYSLSILSTGEYFEISDGKVYCDMHAVAQLICTEEREISYIEDMYACGMELSLENSELSTYKYSESEYRDNAQTIYEADMPVDRIVYSASRTGKIIKNSDGLFVPVTTDIVFASGGDLYSCKVRSEIKSDYDAFPESVQLDTNVLPNGNSVEVRLNIHGIIKTAEAAELSVIISAAAEAKEKTGSLPSVYLFRMTDNDLWSLAKRYGSDIDSIMSINKLEKADDALGKMLLIPRIK